MLTPSAEYPERLGLRQAEAGRLAARDRLPQLRSPLGVRGRSRGRRRMVARQRRRLVAGPTGSGFRGARTEPRPCYSGSSGRGAFHWVLRTGPQPNRGSLVERWRDRRTLPQRRPSLRQRPGSLRARVALSASLDCPNSPRRRTARLMADSGGVARGSDAQAGGRDGAYARARPARRAFASRNRRPGWGQRRCARGVGGRSAPARRAVAAGYRRDADGRSASDGRVWRWHRRIRAVRGGRRPRDRLLASTALARAAVATCGWLAGPGPRHPGSRLERLERQDFHAAPLVALRRSLDTSGVPASAAIRRLHRLVELHDWQHNQFFAPVAAALLWGTHLAWAIEGWRRTHGSQVRPGCTRSATSRHSARCRHIATSIPTTCGRRSSTRARDSTVLESVIH